MNDTYKYNFKLFLLVLLCLGIIVNIIGYAHHSKRVLISMDSPLLATPNGYSTNYFNNLGR
jgi:hypothetical protein